MYSPSDLIRGIRNPKLARIEVERKIYQNLLDPVYNDVAEIGNSHKNSNCGLVLNYNGYRTDRFPVAELPHLIREIIDRENPLIITSQDEYDRQKHRLDKIISLPPKGRMAPGLSYDTRLNQTIAILLGHPHSGAKFWLEDYVEDNEINYVLSRYYEPFFEYFSGFNKQNLIHFPWSVPKQFVIDPSDIQPRYRDIVKIFGPDSHDMYETRRKCKEHPNVDSEKNTGKNKVYSNNEYYYWLRNFNAMIAASSPQPRYQYVFAKYFEIAASGSLLFAQYADDLDKLGFNENNCIIFNHDDAWHKIDDYIEKKDPYIELRKNAANLIMNRHTTENRVDRLFQLIDIR